MIRTLVNSVTGVVRRSGDAVHPALDAVVPERVAQAADTLIRWDPRPAGALRAREARSTAQAFLDSRRRRLRVELEEHRPAHEGR